MDQRDRSRSRSPERNDSAPTDQYASDSKQNGGPGEDAPAAADPHRGDAADKGGTNPNDSTEEVKLYVGNLDYGKTTMLLALR